MATVFLSPVGGAGWQFFDNNGDPLTGGKLYTYAAGTTTPQTTYTTSAGTPGTEHANPIILNAAGRVAGSGEIWLVSGQRYKFLLKDTNDVLIATYDNINGVGSVVVINYTGTGSQVAFNITGSVANVFINGVYQNKNTYSVSGTTLTFSEAPPFNSIIEIQTV